MNRSRITARSLALAILVPALALAACAKDDDAESPATEGTAVSPPPPPPPAAAATPAAGAPNDAQIASIALTANSVDSASGELAKTRGTNARVKEFANRMVTDHTGVNQQAVALATRLGVTPEDNNTSQQLKAGGQQTRERLNGMSGDQFDRTYIDSEIEYHETVLQALDQTLIPNAQNAELKALLTQVRPAVAAHLEMARQIRTELQGS